MPESSTAAAAMGIESMWQYTTKTEGHFNGETKTVCRCNFCNVILGAANATRIEEHLSGLRLRNGNLDKVRKPYAVVSVELRSVLRMNKEKSHKAKGDKKNAAMAFLQRSASLNYKNSEAMPQQKLPDMMNNTKLARGPGSCRSRVVPAEVGDCSAARRPCP